MVIITDTGFYFKNQTVFVQNELLVIKWTWCVRASKSSNQFQSDSRLGWLGFFPVFVVSKSIERVSEVKMSKILEKATGKNSKNAHGGGVKGRDCGGSCCHTRKLKWRQQGRQQGREHRRNVNLFWFNFCYSHSFYSREQLCCFCSFSHTQISLHMHTQSL